MADIRETIIKLTNTITKTSGEIVKSTKLTMNLNTEEEKLKQIYIEIGKKVHEIYAYGGSLGKAFDEKYKEIVKQEEIVEQIREEMNRVKGMKECPKCGGAMEKGAEFCIKCGNKLGSDKEGALPEKNIKEATVSEPVTEPEPDVKETEKETEVIKESKLCNVCGKENFIEDKFCLYCGRML